MQSWVGIVCKGCREGGGGRLERGEVEGAAHASRLELARGAQLEVAVADDGVRLLTANLLLLALHVDLVLRLAAGGARADPLLDGLRLPAAAAGGFADGRRIAQRVGGELLGDGWAGRRRVRECLDAGEVWARLGSGRLRMGRAPMALPSSGVGGRRGLVEADEVLETESLSH